MRRIHQLVWYRQAHGELPGSLQVAAPPVPVAMVLLDALDNNQQIWIDGLVSIARLLGRQPPVRAWIAIAPGRRAVGLISQVSPDDRIVTPVVPGQHDPIMDPTRLGYLVRVPQIGPEIGGSVVAVKDKLQTMAAGPPGKPIHECPAPQPPWGGGPHVVY